jgi:hypothetical protein
VTYPPQPQDAIVLVSGVWKPTMMTTLGLGYTHDFSVALVGQYYNLDRIQLTFSQLLWRIVATLRGGWEERRYEGDMTAEGLLNGSRDASGKLLYPNRVDDLVLLHLDLNLPIRNWFVVGVGDDVEMNFSNCKSGVTSLGTAVAAIPCDYKRNDVWGRLTVTY